MTGRRNAIGRRTALTRLRRFAAREDGVATIDWVLVCCGATAAGAVALSMGTDAFTAYSADLRGEVQGQYFQAAWTEQLNIPRQDAWQGQAPISSASGQSGTAAPWGGNDIITEVVTGVPVVPDGATQGCGSSGTGPDCTGEAPVTGDPLPPDPPPTGGGGGGTAPPPPPPPPPTIVNGDFSTNDATGWLLLDGQSKLEVYSQGLAFNTQNLPAGGVALQTVTVQPGQAYNLDFNLWENGWGVAEHTILAVVFDGAGQIVASLTAVVGNGQNLNFTLPFVSQTQQVTLYFGNPFSTGTVATDVLLDNVSISLP